MGEAKAGGTTTEAGSLAEKTSRRRGGTVQRTGTETMTTTANTSMAWSLTWRRVRTTPDTGADSGAGVLPRGEIGVRSGGGTMGVIVDDPRRRRPAIGSVSVTITVRIGIGDAGQAVGTVTIGGDKILSSVYWACHQSTLSCTSYLSNRLIV